MTTKKTLQVFAWGLSAIVAGVAIVAWGQGIDWKLGSLSLYKLFPLLGLLAFSIMWSHYIASVARQIYSVDKAALKQYFEITSWIVLVAIFLHPGMLIYALFRDGFGLPPESYIKHYVAPGAAWAVLLGTVSFMIFLCYELRRKYEHASWWKYVSYASDAAMVAIVVHSLKLGALLQTGWLKTVWYFYGITLLMSLGYSYYQKCCAEPPRSQ